MRPNLQLLETSLIERIVDEALTVLEKTGVDLEGDEAIKRLLDAGLPVDATEKKIRFPRKLVEEAIQSSPSCVSLFNRDGDLHAQLQGESVHFVPASSALRVMDRTTSEIRDPTSKDLVEFAKVCDGLKNISYLATAFTPQDVPQDMADAWRLYLILAHSKKPVVSGAFTSYGVERMARIMAYFRKDREDLIQKPLALFTCCPNTPLRWGEDPLHNIIDCADWGIPIEIVPVLLLGMISPATTIGALVLHTAEVLSGLAIAQAIRPGTPVVFGGAPATFHMRLMTNPMTAVEALQIYCSYGQIARHLKLPSQAYMGLSDSKRNDAQAGAETGIGMFLAALSGINSVSGPGMLDYVNCFSLEKLVFDDELAAHALRFIRPVTVKDDLPTQELIAELIQERHLLTSEHTLQYWPEELYLPGPLIDRTNWDQWELAGSKMPRDQALEIIDEQLDNHEVEPLEPALHHEIQDLFRKTCKVKDVILPEFS